MKKSPQIAYYTDMQIIFDGLGISAADYDWYLSDIDTNIFVDRLSHEDHWITGQELRTLLNKYDIQFNWAVFSAFPVGARPSIPTPPPYADGQRGFWQPETAKPQHPEAQFEIVCWDSSLTLLIGISEADAQTFKLKYPESVDLDAYNQERISDYNQPSV